MEALPVVVTPPFVIELDAAGNLTLKLDATHAHGVVQALDGYVSLRALAAHIIPSDVRVRDEPLLAVRKINKELREAYAALAVQAQLKRDAEQNGRNARVPPPGMYQHTYTMSLSASIGAPPSLDIIDDDPIGNILGPGSYGAGRDY